MSLRDRVRMIFKKYGFTVFSVVTAVGVVIGVIVSDLKKGLTNVSKGVGNCLKAIGKKIGDILPGMIGAIARAVVGIPLGAVGGLCGGVSVGFSMASKLLSHKVSKHEKTIALAKAKANTIHDLVSKALQDNAISNQRIFTNFSRGWQVWKTKVWNTSKDTERGWKKGRYGQDKNGCSSGNFKGANRFRKLKLSFEISLIKERH